MNSRSDFAIYLVREYVTQDGPFNSIQDIPPGALYLITEDADYSLEVWHRGEEWPHRTGEKWWLDYDINGFEYP